MSGSEALVERSANPDRGSRSLSLGRLSTRHLWLLAPFLGLALGSSGPIRDNSFLWHVRAGDLQLESGEVIRTDPFSFTMAGESWRTQSWLIELVYGVLERSLGDLRWVPVFVFAISALTFALIAFAIHREVQNVAVTAALIFFLTWLGLAYISPRPVIASYLLVVLLIVTLQRRILWTIPFVLWVWAAVHGSFVLGLGLLLVWSLRDGWTWRRHGWSLGAGVVAVSATAHGVGIWTLIVDFAQSRQALMLIEEWAAPQLLEPRMLPYAMLLAVLFHGASAGRLGRRDLWVVVPFAIFGLTAERAIFPAALVLVVFSARSLKGAWQGLDRSTSPGSWRLNSAISAVLAALMIGLLTRPAALDPNRFPLEAAEAIGPGPVFHDDRVGGYLIYARWPGHRVFIDDRAELHGSLGFERLVAIRRGGDLWREVFARYGIHQVLLRHEEGLVEELLAEGWRRVTIDGDFVLLRES